MRVYADDNGQVLFTYSGPDELAPEGAFIETEDRDLDDLTRWAVADGMLHEAPGPWAAWDSTAWIDPRGPADHAAALEAARDAAHMETAVFLTVIALPPLSIITPEESMAASRSGEVPASFQAILDMMDPAERLLAMNKWARDEYVSRNNPLLNFVAIGQYGPVNADAILDQIFGIEVPA